MKNLKNLYLDPKKTPEVLNKELQEYIDNFTKNNELDLFLDWLSNKTELPKPHVTQDCKHFLFNNFSKKTNKFSKKFQLSYIFYSLIRYLLFLIWIVFFKKKNNKKFHNVDLVLEDVHSEDEINRLSLFQNHFNKVFFITSFQPKKIKNFYLFNNYKNLNFNISKTLKLFGTALVKSLFFSIKLKTNLIDITFHLLKLNLKYDCIFQDVNGKYLLQERHYSTGSIKHYLFKKYGGKKYAVLQKNIAQLLGPGTYCSADYFFTLGEKTSEQAIVSGGKFEKIYPVGSLFMESRYFNEIKSNVPEYDLVNIASNLIGFSDGNEKFLNNWYLHFEWIKKFSEDFPQYKVVIKLKEDKLEFNKKLNDIFKNSNVKFIKSFHSYHIAFKAKATTTFASTIGFELIGHGCDCVFLDPLNCNTSFLPKNDIHNLIKITNYEDFKKDSQNKILNKKLSKNYNRNDYCLDSEKSSKRISDFLKNQ